MLATVDLFPQLLTARHMYFSASDLLMLVKFNQFLSMNTSEPTFDQVIVGERAPAEALQVSSTLPSFVTFLAMFVPSTDAETKTECKWLMHHTYTTNCVSVSQRQPVEQVYFGWRTTV